MSNIISSFSRGYRSSGAPDPAYALGRVVGRLLAVVLAAAVAVLAVTAALGL